MNVYLRSFSFQVEMQNIIFQLPSYSRCTYIHLDQMSMIQTKNWVKCGPRRWSRWWPLWLICGQFASSSITAYRCQPMSSMEIVSSIISSLGTRVSMNSHYRSTTVSVWYRTKWYLSLPGLCFSFSLAPPHKLTPPPTPYTHAKNSQHIGHSGDRNLFNRRQLLWSSSCNVRLLFYRHVRHVYGHCTESYVWRFVGHYVRAAELVSPFTDL